MKTEINHITTNTTGDNTQKLLVNIEPAGNRTRDLINCKS